MICLNKLVGMIVACVAPSMGLIAYAQAATINQVIYMRADTRSFTIDLHGHNRLYNRSVWIEGFTDVAGSLPYVSGVNLYANEGDTINLTVYNNTNEDREFTLRNGWAAPAGSPANSPALNTPVVTVVAPQPIPRNTSKIVSFTAPAAGIYLYYDSKKDSTAPNGSGTGTGLPNRSAGMIGTLIVYPTGQPLARGNGNADAPIGGTIWAGGPAFNREYIWVLSDFDKKWNASFASGTLGSGVSAGAYKATYAFINGHFGYESLHNKKVHNQLSAGYPNHSPRPNVHDVVLIRIVNTGTIPHPLHFHGYHGKVYRVNNQRQDGSAAGKYIVYDKDVIDVPAMSTMDVLFEITQKGMYVIHDHTGMMVTQDGIYAEGMIAMFDTCTRYYSVLLTDKNHPDYKYCMQPTIGVGF